MDILPLKESSVSDLFLPLFRPFLDTLGLGYGFKTHPIHGDIGPCPAGFPVFPAYPQRQRRELPHGFFK
jgi:hypothetical protein